MLFRGLRNKKLRRGFEQLIKKREAALCLQELRTLGVLIDASKPVNIMSLVRLSDELGVKSDGLRVIGYKEDYNEGSARIGETHYFGDRGISLGGSIKSDFLKDFVSKEFDVLINFYGEDHLVINYVAAASRARFKVGFTSVDHRINDLVIASPPENTNLFISELKKYLKILEMI